MTTLAASPSRRLTQRLPKLDTRLVVGLLLAARIPDKPQEMVTFEVALEPPKGVIQGRVDGTGTPFIFVSAAAK